MISCDRQKQMARQVMRHTAPSEVTFYSSIVRVPLVFSKITAMLSMLSPEV